jgi:hypothetical protein
LKGLASIAHQKERGFKATSPTTSMDLKTMGNYFFLFFQKSAKWHTLSGLTGSNFISESKTIIATFTA